MHETVPFVGLARQSQRLRNRTEVALAAVLDHGQYVMGPEIATLEQRLGARVGGVEAVAVSSGTDALLMALMAYGVGQGDAVFVPSFTFTATAEVVLVAGATPVFVDVDATTFNLDPRSLTEQIERVCEKGELRPRAAIAVDLFGRPASYGQLMPVAEEHGLLLIDDAAQAIGAECSGRPIGSVAPITTTSFFPAKPLGCYGDGGAVFATDHDVAKRLRSIRQHGEGNERYEIVRIGINGRLDSFQAAVLLIKLDVFEQELQERDRIARIYRDRLGDIVACPGYDRGDRSAWAQYTIQTEYRDRARSRLAERGVPTALYYPKPMHLQAAYSSYGEGRGSLPVSEALCARVLSLPLHPYLTSTEIDRVCEAVHEVVTE